jgi:hypothetical protein
MKWPGIVVVAAAIALPVEAVAQTKGIRHRFEITGGGGLQTGADLGNRNGDLRANSTTPQPFPLFITHSDMARAWLADARVGFVVSPRVTVEGRLGYSRPSLDISVSADTEGAAAITVVERIDQYVIDAGIVIRLDEVRIGRLTPYVAGGAGYLRQLHE